ncbi:MAG: aminotransferase class V-fold PLP-dependent enzyme [Acidimicrobiales bacterium]
MTSPDFSSLKKDFPILQTERHGKPLTFLDSAASSQRPTQVIDAMDYTYTHAYANVHRGVYGLAEAATNAYETARLKVARFIGAPDSSEIIFTKNATEALNLVAFSWGKANLGPSDAIVLTTMEHHANIVPWQMLQAEKGFEIRWIPLGDDGKLDLSRLDALLDGAKLLSVASMSNVLGTINPLDNLIAAARKAGATVCIDACQSVPHMPTNVAELGADFLAFSGHKMLGPSGIGVLWARMELLDAMPPFLGGGGMISNVTTEGFIPDAVPSKFEAGTPPIVEAIGLGAAIDYLESVGMDNIRQHEIELTAYAMRTLTERLGDVLTIHGPSEPAERGGVLSIELEGVHAHDVSQILDSHGVAVRPGHHCAKPLMKELGVNATARASFYLYNDTSDVDTLADALCEAHSFFAI